MYEIILKHTADKELKKIEKGDKIGALKIRTFLQELEKIENPFVIKSVTKLEAFKNYWHWRVGNYRVIGIKQDEILIIEIIEISTRENTYKK